MEPTTSRTSEFRRRFMLMSRLLPREPVTTLFTIVNKGSGGPVEITAGAPASAPGLIERSRALSLTVRELTSAPYHHWRSSQFHPDPYWAPLKYVSSPTRSPSTRLTPAETICAARSLMPL